MRPWVMVLVALVCMAMVDFGHRMDWGTVPLQDRRTALTLGPGEAACPEVLFRIEA